LTTKSGRGNRRSCLKRGYATGGHPYPFRVGCRFDDKEGHVVADQLRAVDGDRLIKHLGVLDEGTLVKVLSFLQAMFAV